MREALDAIYDALAAREAVYLHCWAGSAAPAPSSPPVARAGYTGPEALAVIARKWQVVQKRVRHPASP
jgi:hypothetical protein